MFKGERYQVHGYMIETLYPVVEHEAMNILQRMIYLLVIQDKSREDTKNPPFT